MKREIWKSIKNYENLYEASNYGRVRSMWYGKIRILKLNKVKGYLHVQLWKDGKYKNFQVHRLVYEAFHGTIPDGYEINHIDENPLNNCLSNLSAVSHKENINWGTCVQRRVDKQSQAVLQLTLDKVLIKEYPSMAEAERQTGISHGNISNCCNGKCKQTNGFLWMKKLPLS